MRRVVTGVLVQVEITYYNEAGQVEGRPPKPVQFGVSEANIPEPVLEWVRNNIQKEVE